MIIMEISLPQVAVNFNAQCERTCYQTTGLVISFLKGAWHLWYLSKTSILTCCIPTSAPNNLCKFGLNIGHLSCQKKIMKEKTPLHKMGVLLDAWERLQVWSLPQIQMLEWEITAFSKTRVRNYHFLKSYVTPEASYFSQCCINSFMLLVNKYLFCSYIFWAPNVPSAFIPSQLPWEYTTCAAK